MLEVRFNPPVQRLSSILLLKLKVWWWETSTSNLAYFAFAYQETFSSGTTLRNTLFNCVTQVFLGIIAFFVDNFWQLDIIFSTFWLGHISPEILHCHLCLQSRQWVAVTALRWRPGSRLQRLWTRQREIEDRDIRWSGAGAQKTASQFQSRWTGTATADCQVARWKSIINLKSETIVNQFWK